MSINDMGSHRQRAGDIPGFSCGHSRRGGPTRGYEFLTNELSRPKAGPSVISHLAPVRGAGSAPRIPPRPADPGRPAFEGFGRAAGTRPDAPTRTRPRDQTGLFLGPPRGAEPASGSVSTPTARAPTLNRCVPRTGPRRRTRVGRVARRATTQSLCRMHSSSRAAPRSPLLAATACLPARSQSCDWREAEQGVAEHCFDAERGRATQRLQRA